MWEDLQTVDSAISGQVALGYMEKQAEQGLKEHPYRTSASVSAVSAHPGFSSGYTIS